MYKNVSSCLVWCSFKEPLPLYTVTASFPMVVFNARIMSRLLFLLSNMVSPHLFNLSSQLIFWEPRAQRLLVYVWKGAVYNIQLLYKHLALSSVFPCPVSGNRYLHVIFQLWPNDAVVQPQYIVSLVRSTIFLLIIQNN